MQTVVLVIMVLIVFNFLLKQTFHKGYYVVALAVTAALFVGLMWPMAIEQSKSQIATWLENPSLMLDTSVLLTLEVALQMAFCLMAAEALTVGFQKKSALWIYRVLWFFPGVLVFAVLFSLLVAAIYHFPGVSFSLVAWVLALAVLVVVITGTRLIRKLLPEEDIRLELLFLTNALVAILGIVATVNGRTAVEGVSEVNWPALGMMMVLLAAGTVAGVLIRKRRMRKL